MNAQYAYHKLLETIIQEIHLIYARWRAGEISQEDALFEIGDSLEKLAPFPEHNSDPTHRDQE
jgi:hypothetical protein